VGFVAAIDPGIRSPGAALFLDAVLVAAARISIPKTLHEGELGLRAHGVGAIIAAWLDGARRKLYDEFTPMLGMVDVVYEWPQIYRASRSKGRPGDLLKTLATGAAAVAHMSCVADVHTPTPHDWAGNTKKATTGDPWVSERARMVARRLSAEERALVPASHDAIDAVALGLWRVGRFDAIRVNYGATPG